MANVSMASRLVAFFFPLLFSFLLFFFPPLTIFRYHHCFQVRTIFSTTIRFEVFLDGEKKREEGKKRKIISISFPLLSLSSFVSSFVTPFLLSSRIVLIKRKNCTREVKRIVRDCKGFKELHLTINNINGEFNQQLCIINERINYILIFIFIMQCVQQSYPDSSYGSMVKIKRLFSQCNTFEQDHHSLF